MLAVGLVLSVLLPLLAGLPWLLLVQRESAPGGLPVAIGYGYVLGLLIIVGGIRVLSLASVPIGLSSEIGILAAASASRTRSGAMPSVAAISSGVGSRPS